MNILPYYRCVESVQEFLGYFHVFWLLIESSESVDNELSYIGTVEVVVLFFFFLARRSCRTCRQTVGLVLFIYYVLLFFAVL